MDIQSLASRAQELERVIGFWNAMIILGMVLTAVTATFLVMAQARAFGKARDLAQVNKEISDILSKQMADALNKAADATMNAGKAVDRAGLTCPPKTSPAKT